ncbi:MAG: serine--tRNA ligase [Candidatus Moranbacteria bacterium]|nr:serine--tRNA ligase [Candidatus Moranbacteria bacterium]
MLDIKFIRDHKEELKKAISNKGIDLDVDELLKMDDKRRELLGKVEELNSLKNDINELVKEAKSEEERKEVIEKGKEIKDKLAKDEPQYETIKRMFDLLMVKVPTIPSPDTPVGKSEKDNAEISRWGEIPKFGFAAKDHIQLGKELDILDLERGVKVAGYRGYYVKNEGVTLVMGLMMYALGKMIEKGYAPVIPPTLVKEFALFGSGYFKGKEYDLNTDEIYQVATSDKEATGEASKDKKFLVGTAEPSLLAYYAGDILEEKNLPLKICGFSQCYRSEIGSYGKDTKGIYRVHEFMKVEQVVLCPADIAQSEKVQQEMISISREMYEELGLPYRQVQVCTGEMGAGKYKMFDLEVWIPSRNAYGEGGSASNFLDWQARRLKVKYVDKEGNKRYAYMLNNTALASPRIFIAILENFQQADGSVKVPEVLKKYMPVAADVIKKKV